MEYAVVYAVEHTAAAGTQTVIRHILPHLLEMVHDPAVATGIRASLLHLWHHHALEERTGTEMVAVVK